MKKTLCAVFIFITIHANAQKLVVHIGSSVTNLNHEDIWGFPHDQIKISFTGSLGIQYLHTKLFSLTSNLGYLQKGGKDFDPARGNIIRRINYLTLNTVLKIKYPGTGKINPFLNAGLYAGTPLDENPNKYYKKFNTGAVLGLGLCRKLLKHEIGMEANYLPSFNLLGGPMTGIDSRVSTADHSFTVTAFFVL